MKGETQECWQKLRDAARERDVERLIVLIQEINRLLEEHRAVSCRASKVQ